MAERARAFWEFSLAFYGRGEVQAAALALQDRHGLDVNLLLYACWLGIEEGVALAPAERDAALARVAAWRREVVLPLRAARRAIKAAAPEGAAAYAAAKSAELEAERVAQRLMATGTPPPRTGLSLARRRALAAANLEACLPDAKAARAAAPLLAALATIGDKKRGWRAR